MHWSGIGGEHIGKDSKQSLQIAKSVKGLNNMKKYRGHTTHYACDEIMKRDGDKAIGCCCSCHECKDETPRTISDILKRFDERYDQYNPINDKGNQIPVWTGSDYGDIKDFLVQSIKDALEAVRVHRYSAEPAPKGWDKVQYNAAIKHYESGWNSNIAQYDENIKKFLGEDKI